MMTFFNQLGNSKPVFQSRNVWIGGTPSPGIRDPGIAIHTPKDVANASALSAYRPIVTLLCTTTVPKAITDRIHNRRP